MENNRHGTETWTVPDDCDGVRLDKALSTHPKIQSRNQATELIRAGRVTSDKKAFKPSDSVHRGQTITILWPEPESVELKPLAMDLAIVYQDKDIAVINKPAGLVVHPAAGHKEDTLVNALVHAIPDLAMGFGDRRPGIVHRLDKDTSGLLVIAKNNSAQLHLMQQFKARTAHRLYWAIVFGVPNPDKGRIESYLLRHPQHRLRFASERLGAAQAAKGKRAITNYEVKRKHTSGLSLVHCRLETGRTHQIRVHLSEKGHPLIGDVLYGAKSYLSRIRSNTLKESILNLKRIGLHAAELGFVHPTSHQALQFKADWPDDLMPVLDELEWS